MFGNEKLKTPNLHADYAQLVDFCEVFERDMKPLYLLAFLLTASHQAAERCFASTVEEALKSQAIFKEWRRSWVKRSVIKNAIQIVSPASGRATQKRDLWSAQHRGKPGDVEIDAVTARLRHEHGGPTSHASVAWPAQAGCTTSEGRGNAFTKPAGSSATRVNPWARNKRGRERTTSTKTNSLHHS